MSDSAITQPYVFISYQRDSEAEAREVHDRLIEAKFRVWQDVENIRHTARWSVAINQALRDTDRIVLLLTPTSMQSEEVFNEWFFFYSKRKPLHLLLLETCDIHYQLLPFQYLDWRDPAKRDWQRLFDELMAPFEWPSVAYKEKVVNTDFAPQRSLPEALDALRQVLLSDTGVVALSSVQLDEIRRHKPADETEFRLARYAEWCGPRYQLDERFVRLTILLHDTEKGWVPQGGPQRFEDLRDVLAQPQAAHTMVLLGAPGAGKSTLLRRLEMDTAVDALRDPDHTHPLTFFVSLAEYGLGLPDDKVPDPFDWLSTLWQAKYPDLPSLDTLLHERRMLLLLDSLNEMPHTDADDFRRRADRWRAFLYTYVRDRPGNRALFACRTLDYGSVLSTDEYPIPQIQLEPMTPEQVRTYLNQYAPDHADLIWDSFQRDPRQFDLFRIPFMLQLLIKRVKVDGRLPQGRAETFNGFVYDLMRREALRRHPLFQEGPLLTRRDLKTLLENESPRQPYALPEGGRLIPLLTALAYAMQERKSGEEKGLVIVDYDDALDLLGTDNGTREDALSAGCAMNVLDEMDQRICYYHQLVQEFFAARKLAADPQPGLVRVEWHVERVSPTLAETLARIADSDPLPPLPATGWEETTLLAAAMSADPDAFVRGLMDANLPLAARCAAAPDVNVSSALCDEIRQALIARTQHPQADLRARIDAGLALGEIGDPRFERRTGPFGDYLLPPMVPIEGGTYPLGLADGPYDDEKPAHTVELDAFEIGKFLVTNAEYALFMAAGGYEDEQWWDTDAAKAWWRGEGTAEGLKQQWRDDKKVFEGWSEDYIRSLVPEHITSEQARVWLYIRSLPQDEFERQLEEVFPSGEIYRQPRFWNDSTYNNPAQPVVGICWYEARAYCAWLTAQVFGSPRLVGEGPGVRVFRLPTEAEWEAAARGKAGRLYPYGPAFDAALSNTFESHIRRTTPVGIFPGGDTPEGLVDMSGNVWEWTSTVYRPYPYRADDGREDPALPDAPRVLRGGSWYLDQANARAVYRNLIDPGDWSGNGGFRVVCGVSLIQQL